MMKLRRPPMGWNSWDCYGASVTEAEVRANAEYMASHLKEYGWEYVVVDIQWFEPKADGCEYREGAELVMDEFGRLLPAVNRFPSAAGGRGFAPLGEYIHSLGLKFGIHILRGIPRQALRENCHIKGTQLRALDVADDRLLCEWNHDMCSLNYSLEGAQEYYDSIFQLYAEWGVDFVKVDDISRPYHEGEVELIRRAIDGCGREMVLSLSPGCTPISAGPHVSTHANMWRMSDDFWDKWSSLREMFDLCRSWFPYTGGGAFPDADMLPLGRIGIRSVGEPRYTNFTREEQKTMMTLWTIFRSPLMFGGDLTMNDEWTLSLLQNKHILHVLNHSHAGREVLRKGNIIVWTAGDDNGRDRYLAVFNVGEIYARYTPELSFIGVEGGYTAYDLWEDRDAELSSPLVLPPHGCGYFRVTPEEAGQRAF